MGPSDVHAELSEVAIGRKPERSDPDRITIITIFDSGGVGILDGAALARAYRLASEQGAGRSIALS